MNEAESTGQGWPCQTQPEETAVQREKTERFFAVSFSLVSTKSLSNQLSPFTSLLSSVENQKGWTLGSTSDTGELISAGESCCSAPPGFAQDMMAGFLLT